MVELLVMRHAKSAWDTGDVDYDRPLNERGERAADRMAEYLLANDLCPDRIVASAAARTRATALAVMHTCAVDRSTVDFERDLYGAGARQWIDVMREQSCQRLLLCGHNPGLDDLVETLCDHRPPLSATGKLMTTAAVAHFRLEAWPNAGRDTAELISIIRPREL